MQAQKRLAVLSFVFVFLVTIVGPLVLLGQTSTSGTVVGTITDPSGAVVPNASVQLVNTQTNAVLNTQTNSAGEYTFPNVAPGNYKITVSAAGFRTSTV